MQSEYEKMIAGEIYRPQDEDLRKIRDRSKEFQYRFNQEQEKCYYQRMVWQHRGESCYEARFGLRLRN